MNVKYLGSTNDLKNNMKIVSTAGMLSRSKGVVSDVLNKRNDYEKNVNIIKKIINYGHKSITEHQYLVFAIEDVSPIVEQTLINHRLTSFTVKSRRNVDFRSVGFYVPNFKYKDGSVINENKLYQDKYIKHMKHLFDEYGILVDQGLPIEDCRYILPYCYHSNIIMGCDANELLKIVKRLKYGKESRVDELKELALKFEEIIKVETPYLIDLLSNGKEYTDNLSFLDNYIRIEDYISDNVELNKHSSNPDLQVCLSAIQRRYQVDFKKDLDIYYDELLVNEPDIKEKIINALLKQDHNREFEQVNFTYSMPISLAVLTHLTRHRMHSLLVPDFYPLWNMDNYIIPDSIKNENRDKYIEIFKENKRMLEEFKKAGIRDEDLIYFYLSGQKCRIKTTMNARSLIWISRMRCCKKAQWEIRDLINECVRQTKEVAPLIGKCLGPSCEVEGVCKEGNDSCLNGPVKLKKK